jgi:phosphoserine phosphatase
MIELLAYLRENGFKTFIVSGASEVSGELAAHPICFASQ